MYTVQIQGLEFPASQLSMGTGWFDPQFEDEIFHMLDSYVALGGNVLDTGRFYNGGKSESLVSRWLKASGCRDKLLITNKACHHYVDENNVHHIEESRVRPDCITEDLHYSLRNLDLAHIDIYLMHRDDQSQPVEPLIDRLEQHRREGLIRVYGVSNWSIPRIAAAQAYAARMGYDGLRVNSPSYSLATIVKPRFHGCVYADEAYVDWHRGSGITLIVWASLAVGFFTGCYKQDGSTPPDIAGTYFCEENFRKLARVQQLAAEKNVEPIHISLAYVLSHPVPMLAAIGPRTEAECRSLIAAAGLRLTPEEVLWLRTGRKTAAV